MNEVFVVDDEKEVVEEEVEVVEQESILLSRGW